MAQPGATLGISSPEGPKKLTRGSAALDKHYVGGPFVTSRTSCCTVCLWLCVGTASPMARLYDFSICPALPFGTRRSFGEARLLAGQVGGFRRPCRIGRVAFVIVLSTKWCPITLRRHSPLVGCCRLVRCGPGNRNRGDIAECSVAGGRAPMFVIWLCAGLVALHHIRTCRLLQVVRYIERLRYRSLWAAGAPSALRLEACSGAFAICHHHPPPQASHREGQGHVPPFCPSPLGR